MPAQRDWSKLGSSYIAALTGDPDAYLTPIEVWLKMTKQTNLLPRKNDEISEAMYWGNKLEKPIIESFTEDFGFQLVENHTLYMGDYFCDTPDGINVKNRILLEVKNVRQSKAWMWEQFVPKVYYPQIQWHIKHFDHEMQTLKLESPKKCYVRALIGGCQKVDYIVPRDDEIITDLDVIADDFINNYVKPVKEPPIDCTKEYGKYLFRKYPELDNLDNKEFIEITKELDAEAYNAFFKLMNQTLQKKNIEADITLCENVLKSRIGSKYGVKSEFGKVIWPFSKGRVSHKKAIEEFLKMNPVHKDTFDKLLENSRGEDSRTLRKYFK